MHYQYFPEEQIALMQEIQNHPDLLTILAVQQHDPHLHLAEIAAYCNILLDGTYTAEDINKLCDIMTRKLQEKRAIIVLPT